MTAEIPITQLKAGGSAVCTTGGLCKECLKDMLSELSKIMTGLDRIKKNAKS